MPVIVVLPGIAAYVLWKDGLFKNEMLYDGETNPDRAYPVLLNLLPAGLKGLSFAALTAAVVASLAGNPTVLPLSFLSMFIIKSLIRRLQRKSLFVLGKLQ